MESLFPNRECEYEEDRSCPLPRPDYSSLQKAVDKAKEVLSVIQQPTMEAKVKKSCEK